MVKHSVTSTWSLTGVVSQGFNDQSNSDEFAVFVNVKMFLPWILENANYSFSYSNYFSSNDGRSRVMKGNSRVKRACMFCGSTPPCPRGELRDSKGKCKKITKRT